VLNTLNGKFLRGIEFQMVISIDWRGPFLEYMSKDRMVLIDNLLNISFGSPCKCVMRIPEEVTPKMIGDILSSL
jgi:hypothetical protein